MWHEKRKAEALEATFCLCLMWNLGRAISPRGSQLLRHNIGANKTCLWRLTPHTVEPKPKQLMEMSIPFSLL